MKHIIFLILFLISCNTPQNYKVIGVIKEIHENEKKLLIDHEEIPGFMVKMVMFFNLHESIDINQFAVNDSVSFNLIIKDKSSYTTNYKILGKSKNLDGDSFWNDDKDSKYSLKEPGEYIDNASFINTDNKDISISYYDFIYFQ